MSATRQLHLSTQTGCQPPVPDNTTFQLRLVSVSHPKTPPLNSDWVSVSHPTTPPLNSDWMSAIRQLHLWTQTGYQPPDNSTSQLRLGKFQPPDTSSSQLRLGKCQPPDNPTSYLRLGKCQPPDNSSILCNCISVGWGFACLTVSKLWLPIRMQPHGVFGRLTPFLDYACCYALSMSWLKIVPT